MADTDEEKKGETNWEEGVTQTEMETSQHSESLHQGVLFHPMTTEDGHQPFKAKQNR